MRLERRIVASLRDITAVTLACNRCGARATLPLATFQTLPPTCPGAEGHNWQEDGLSPTARVPALLRDAAKAKGTDPRGFELYLEFEDVKP